MTARLPQVFFKHSRRLLAAIAGACLIVGCQSGEAPLNAEAHSAPATQPLTAEALVQSLISNSGLQAGSSATRPATQPADPAWPDIDRVMQRRGVARDGVYVFTIPRDDLDVSIDGMGIPTAAGIESIFYFYRCPCGKMSVTGQFVTTDYEADDVVDALRHDAVLSVSAVSPFLISERPRLMVVRFQGEGDPAAMARNLREALRWIGRERMAPLPADSPKSPAHAP